MDHGIKWPFSKRHHCLILTNTNSRLFLFSLRSPDSTVFLYLWLSEYIFLVAGNQFPSVTTKDKIFFKYLLFSYIRGISDFCISITFSNHNKAFFYKLYPVTIQTCTTQIVTRTFIIENLIVTWFLQIIGVQNQCPITFGTDFIPIIKS